MCVVLDGQAADMVSELEVWPWLQINLSLTGQGLTRPWVREQDRCCQCYLVKYTCKIKLDWFWSWKYTHLKIFSSETLHYNRKYYEWVHLFMSHICDWYFRLFGVSLAMRSNNLLDSRIPRKVLHNHYSVTNQFLFLATFLLYILGANRMLSTLPQPHSLLLVGW